MSAWIFFLTIAIIFLILEIYMPAMLFLNFALAAGTCAILCIFTSNYNILIPIFVILSILFLLFLRPLFNITKNDKDKNIDSPYIGKQAVTISNVNAFSGRIKIYDEDWEARTTDENLPEIPQGKKVKIVSHNDLTMYVEKLEKKGKK